MYFFPAYQELPRERAYHHHHLYIPYGTCLKDGRCSVNSAPKYHYLKIKIGPVSLLENLSTLLFAVGSNV